MAAGSDGICREITQAAGQPYAQALGRLVAGMCGQANPLRFGGEKTPGRSRDGKLLNLQTCLASIRVLGPGNIFCASLRGTAAPCLRLLAGELQASAVSGGGTQFENFCARLFQRLAASYGLSRSALVADLRKACYAAMLEFGPTITSCDMRQFFVTQGLCRFTRPRDPV